MQDKLSLGKKLAFLSSSDDSFNNPFDEDIEQEEIAVVSPTVMERKFDEIEIANKGKKKAKKDRFSRVIEKGNEIIDEISDGMIDEFDIYLENHFADDEDVDLKNTLMHLGRKYARDTSITAEGSEISKAFNSNEKILDDLLDEIDKDKTLIQKDIDNMRIMRTKNFKTLSELINTKAQFHNTALSVVKELNSIKKTQFDLHYKATKNKEEVDENNSASTKAVQQLFGIGRSNLLSSVGGYEEISGAITSEDELASNEYTDAEDAYIQNEYFADDDTVEDDGDKFLKYENLGVQYILLVEEDGSKQVIAEDRDGNIIPDYPMPSNMDELSFDISETTMTATDDLHRSYIVRKI